MVPPGYRIKYSLWDKIWRGLGALAMVFGLLSITGIQINLPWALLFVISVVFLACYWHAIEWVRQTKTRIIGFFNEIHEDIKFIKSKVTKNQSDTDE